MGVTHIMRGDEFISSMPKFLSIYDALEIPYPVFVTLPPILNEGRTKKLGKRDGAKDILTYDVEGYLPETMLNFLALIGWNPGTEQEVFTKEQLIEAFSLERVIKSNAVYDFNRALWYNSQYISALSDEQFVDLLQEYLLQWGGDEWKHIIATTDRAYRLSCAGYIKVRIQTFGQFRQWCHYFFHALPASQELVCREKMGVTPELLETILPEVIAELEALEPWTEESIKTCLVEYIAKK